MENWTAKEYNDYLAELGVKGIKNLKLKEERRAEDRQERAKFRQHIRRGDYQFCDSYFLEGQDVDGVNK